MNKLLYKKTQEREKDEERRTKKEKVYLFLFLLFLCVMILISFFPFLSFLDGFLLDGQAAELHKGWNGVLLGAREIRRKVSAAVIQQLGGDPASDAGLDEDEDEDEGGGEDGEKKLLHKLERQLVPVLRKKEELRDRLREEKRLLELQLLKGGGKGWMEKPTSMAAFRFTFVGVALLLMVLLVVLLRQQDSFDGYGYHPVSVLR